MRALPFFALLFIGGCWSTGGAALPGDGRSPARIYTRAGTYNATTMSEPQVSTLTVPGAPETVWARLPGAFQDLGLPVNFSQPTQREIGSVNHRLVRSLRDQPISHYLDCGFSVGGINADTHEINLSLVTKVEPASGETTTLRIRIEATATPMGTSASTSSCTSTGRLEEEIVESLATPGS